MLKKISMWKTNEKRYNEIEYNHVDIKDYTLIDVRTRAEYVDYHLDDSINIPLNKLTEKIEKIQPNKNKKIILCCQSGIRSKKAIKILEKMGYKYLYNLKGGLENI